MRMRERRGGCRAGLPACLLTPAVMLNSRVCKQGKRGARFPRWAGDRSIPTFGFPFLWAESISKVEIKIISVSYLYCTLQYPEFPLFYEESIPTVETSGNTNR